MLGRSSQSLFPTACKLKDHLQYKGGHSGLVSSYHVHQVMLDKTRKLNQKARYFSILHDEVTTLDQQPWVSIHCYVMQERGRGGGEREIRVLLVLKHLLERAHKWELEGQYCLLSKNMGVCLHNILKKKVISFGANGVTIIQDVRIGVTMQLKQTFTPFMISVHCMSHRSSLGVQTLNKLLLVAKIKDM